EAFLDAYAKEVGALAHQVSVERAAGQVRTRVAMTVPTAGVPAMFKRLVTPTIDLTDMRTWPADPAPGGWHGALAVDAAARNRDAKVRAALVLEPGGSDLQATRFGVDGDVRVNVPLLGEPAAGLVKDLVASVIKRQSKVMERWLRSG
ncbi:MAG TPA: DUF2505 domain-containing protein, partial [Frankiaceae bacterium]|nr:DUF2505 domain-containing protein [Frankiaceae bacterium]